jgi:hypothetical protein
MIHLYNAAAGSSTPHYCNILKENLHVDGDLGIKIAVIRFSLPKNQLAR